MRIRKWAVVSSAVVILVLATASFASAHVVKQFGTYSVALGWLHEPTYLGAANAVVAIVTDAGGKPVSDLAAGDLTVSVSIAGKQTAALPMEPSYDPDTGFGTPGEYDAALIPTQVGDYTFHLVGSIHGVAVDETATSSDTTFNSVVSGSDVQFPVQLPALSDLATRADRTDQRAADAQAAADSAKQAANQALVVGALVGGLGVILGAAGLLIGFRASRRRSA